MSQLVSYEGDCCIYAYFERRKEETNKQMAAHLGVHPHTIRMWRRRIASGEITCGYEASGKGCCLYFLENHPQNTP
jgi:hypothetical protein